MRTYKSPLPTSLQYCYKLGLERTNYHKEADTAYVFFLETTAHAIDRFVVAWFLSFFPLTPHYRVA
jgi:hypothetical protein